MDGPTGKDRTGTGKEKEANSWGKWGWNALFHGGPKRVK